MTDVIEHLFHKTLAGWSSASYLNTLSQFPPFVKCEKQYFPHRVSRRITYVNACKLLAHNKHSIMLGNIIILLLLSCRETCILP